MPPAIKKIKNSLILITQVIVVALIGFLPFLLLLGNTSLLALDRVVLVSSTIALIGSLAGISLLFKKSIRTIVPKSYAFLGLFVAWGIVSAVSQSDLYDSFWGDSIGVLTTVFSIVLLLSALIPLLIQDSTKMLFRVIAVLQAAGFVVIAHTVVWYWTGLSVLSLGKLAGSETLVGSFTDVGVYAGLIVLFGLITLLLLPIKKRIQLATTIIIALATILLFMVNVSFVWFVLALTGAVTSLYIQLRRYLFQKVPAPAFTRITKITSGFVLVTAILGIWFGSSIAASLNQVTAVELIDVRPSLESSLTVLQGVYETDALFGVGSNRYEDAWRLHKPLDVNAGALWNANFNAGNSYMMSLFATIGLGAALLVIFHVLFLWRGMVNLIRGVESTIIPRYMTTMLFIGSVFLWVTTYVYTPSTTMLLLTAFLTGLTYAAAAGFGHIKRTEYSLVTNRVAGFVALFWVVIAIAALLVAVQSVWSVYAEQQHPTAHVDSNNDEVLAIIASEKITAVNELIASATPETVTQDDLLTASEAALTATQAAINADPTNPAHHQRQASLYSVLGLIGVSGAYENAIAALEEAALHDPYNPENHFAIAQVYVELQDIPKAQTALETALDLKFNYAAALQLETQILLANGDLEAAITRISKVAQLEPGNADRWYQLGLLHAVAGQVDASIQALVRTVSLSPDSAEVRYTLATQYLKADRAGEAVHQLNQVVEALPNNQSAQELLTAISNNSLADADNLPLTLADLSEIFDSEVVDNVPSTDETVADTVEN